MSGLYRDPAGCIRIDGHGIDPHVPTGERVTFQQDVAGVVDDNRHIDDRGRVNYVRHRTAHRVEQGVPIEHYIVGGGNVETRPGRVFDQVTGENEVLVNRRSWRETSWDRT